MSGWAQQLVNVTYSEPFEKPDGLQIFQCKNGNTFVFKAADEASRTVDVYDKSRKLIAQTQCSYKSFTLENEESFRTNGMYQIADDAVEFMVVSINGENCIFRIIYSQETGKPIREDKIASSPVHGKQKGGITNYGFVVEVDPLTNAYAVYIRDYKSEDKNKELGLIHFDKSHKEIGRGFLDGSTNSNNEIKYQGLVVRGTDDVILLTYGYKSAFSKCHETKLLLSRLKNSVLDYHVIPGCRNLIRSEIVSFVQNPKSNQLQLLTVYESDVSSDMLRQTTTHIYESKLVIIDPTSFSIISEPRLDGRLASQYRKTHYDIKRDFTGIPTIRQHNADGSLTLAMQEMVAGNFQHKGDIGLVNFDAEGKAIDGAAVRYRGTSAMDNNFHQIRLIGNPSNRCIIFNDHPGNFAADLKDDPKQLLGIGAANTACYQIKDGNLSKFYLFGEPNDDFDNRYADVRTDNYSETLKTYVVPVVERKGRKLTYRMAWVEIL